MPQDRIAAGESPFGAVEAPTASHPDPVIQYLIEGLVAYYQNQPPLPWRIELALAIADERFYATSLLEADDVELIRRHDFMDTVAQSSAKQSGPFFVLLEMHAQCLADLCTREGISRGRDPRWGRLH